MLDEGRFAVLDGASDTDIRRANASPREGHGAVRDGARNRCVPQACQFRVYIIVGAGSAGCVLASRLSQDPGVRVLLLEAGGPDWHPYIHVPLGMGRLHERLMFDWGFVTEPEPGLDGRSLEASRGKVLGGSSSINVMAYTRGNPGDFDRWAQKGATGWSYADVRVCGRRQHTGRLRNEPIHDPSWPSVLGRKRVPACWRLIFAQFTVENISLGAR
jgi:choline dehydrogenase-like flavoprotein